jgi:hypothetical protein
MQALNRTRRTPLPGWGLGKRPLIESITDQRRKSTTPLISTSLDSVNPRCQFGSAYSQPESNLLHYVHTHETAVAD